MGRIQSFYNDETDDETDEEAAEQDLPDLIDADDEVLPYLGGRRSTRVRRRGTRKIR